MVCFKSPLIKKTNFIIFCCPQNIYKRDDVNIILNDNKVEQMSHTQVLGIYIDEYLIWEEHIKQLSDKVLQIIGVLWKLKLFLTCKLLLQVNNSFILPYFSCYNLIGIQPMQRG